MRLLIGLGGLVPLPSDAMVTPVTFRVRRRQLRGILAEFDERESGRRELQGEWVVGKKLWKRLQAEWKALHRARDEGALGVMDEKEGRSKGKGRVVLFLHGGEFGSGFRRIRSAAKMRDSKGHIIASLRRRTA